MWCWSFAWMNASWNNYSWLINFIRSLVFLKYAFYSLHSFFFQIEAISDSYEMYLSGFTGFDECLLVKIYLWVFVILFGEYVYKMFWVFVGIWIGKGELYPILVLEGEVEAHLWFLHWIVLNSYKGT